MGGLITMLVCGCIATLVWLAREYRYGDVVLTVEADGVRMGPPSRPGPSISYHAIGAFRMSLIGQAMLVIGRDRRVLMRVPLALNDFDSAVCQLVPRWIASGDAPPVHESFDATLFAPLRVLGAVEIAAGLTLALFPSEEYGLGAGAALIVLGMLHALSYFRANTERVDIGPERVTIAANLGTLEIPREKLIGVYLERVYTGVGVHELQLRLVQMDGDSILIRPPQGIDPLALFVSLERIRERWERDGRTSN